MYSRGDYAKNELPTLAALSAANISEAEDIFSYQRNILSDNSGSLLLFANHHHHQYQLVPVARHTVEITMYVRRTYTQVSHDCSTPFWNFCKTQIQCLRTRNSQANHKS